ncbi:hypothetical protein GPA_28290 [Gordonibacter pamelaeae 7-10-1-b]|uniref:Uncharacterized protein n=1 Tax=Gordonibacter pamelaeae 7-10-1-b TaxID=657308 RepID=D6EAT4_9ACTN|nr:hypothetical protein GPA_28290 [Gordonibacter pamelaeae 7-10-1-b]
MKSIIDPAGEHGAHMLCMAAV